MTSPKPSRRIKADTETNDETLRLLFTNHPTPMWIYDLKTLAFLDVNDAALEKYGYTRDEFLALTIKDIRPTEDVALLINGLEQKHPPLHHSGEWRHCLKNGQVIDVEITTHTMDFRGQKATLVMAQDITERKRAAEKLYESEEKYRAVVDKANDGILIAQDGVIKFSNSSFAAMLGYEVNEMEGIELSRLIPPENMELLLGRYQKRLAGVSVPLLYETGLLHKSGEKIPVEVNASLLKFEGRPADLVFIRDITARKQAEEALRESEEKWRSLVTASPDYIALHDREGMYLFLNHYAEGFTEKDVIGSSVFEYLAPESKDLFRKKMEECLNTLMVQKFEYSAMGDHETLRTYEQYFVPIVSAKKETEILAIARDVTERKQAEDALKEYNTRLETAVEERTSKLREAQEQLVRQEKLAVLGQMAGGVGHELRNPLAVINNALYLLKLVNANGSEKVNEYLGIIQTETHNAEKIITDLLDFARIKSLDVEVFTVSELIHKTLERFPASPSVKVLFEIPERLPPVCADPHHMEQVLGNLVTNACQAMVPSAGMISPSCELTIAVHQEQEMIAIAVQDTGVGITTENMQKLFEPLFTTKAKGIGLGLTVSRKLVEANGGRIEVQSEAGKGSTFTIWLPLAKGIQR